MIADPQALWDLEDASAYRDRVRDASQKVQGADAQVIAARTAWFEAKQSLAKAETAVTEWTLAIEPIPPALWLQRLQALEAEVQRAEEEVRRTKGELNDARAKRGRLWDERRVVIRSKFERYPLEEFAMRQQVDRDTDPPAANGHAAEDKSWAMRQEAAAFAAEVQVETARVPAERLAEAMEEERSAASADSEDKALVLALHGFQGAAERWLQLRVQGATDQQLKVAIGRELGEGGGSSSGQVPVSHKGGSNPTVWFSLSREGKALKGKALIARVRKLLQIPLPLDTDSGNSGRRRKGVSSALNPRACYKCDRPPRYSYMCHSTTPNGPLCVDCLDDVNDEPDTPFVIETTLETLLEQEGEADDTSEPWPDCLDRKDVEAAYIGDRYGQAGDSRVRKPSKPQSVKAFLWQGEIWVCVQKAGTDAHCIYDVVPLLTPEEFAERFPGYATKLAPHLPDDSSEEDARQYFTGVEVRVGRTDYAISPASETRALLWEEQA